MGKIEDLDKARSTRSKTGVKNPRAQASEGKSVAGMGRRRCPICRKPTVQKFRPFCSARCADVDLGRWIGGDYRIAGTPANALNSGEEEEGEEG